MTRIVITSYRYKRPPPKKKPRAVESAAMVVVHAPNPEADGKPRRTRAKQPAAAPPPGRPPLPTVVVATSQKRLKHLRTELRNGQTA
jgi:hypothetical protein